MNYQDPSIWKNYDPDKQTPQRIEFLMSLIPDGVKTVLDAGCGNGLITNELARDYDITGLDSSEAALQYLECPAVQSSIDEIPFPRESFDLVIGIEVLEHLDDMTLIKAISELKRVAKKYIIISVPNREQLNKLYYKCSSCGLVEHPYGHVQSFSKKRLEMQLLPDFQLWKAEFSGHQPKIIFPFF